MGVSTDAQLCYGVIPDEDEYGETFEEGESGLPWDTKESNGDIDHWWTYEIQGFKHSFEIYHNHDFIDGIRPPEDVVDKYYKELFDFRKIEPKLPVELVYHCSDNCPMLILAIPGTIIRAYRGDAIEIDKINSLDYDPDDRTALLDFCDKFGIKHGEPAWFLTSYWG